MVDAPVLRVGIFLGLLLLLIGLEFRFPRQRRVSARGPRWFTNLSITIINTALLRVLSLVGLVAMAEYFVSNQWGLLPMLSLPWGIHLLFSVVLMDLGIYLQHVLSHRIPFLWRFHRVHHSDKDIDVTTAVRFHPGEILLSFVFKTLLVLIIGPLALGILIFEIVLSSSALFNHANLRLPSRIDRLLRYVIVTPDMHKLHHSVEPKETDSNYGFCLSIWDRLFRTYIPKPEKGIDDMEIGLRSYQAVDTSELDWCLLLPFKDKK